MLTLYNTLTRRKEAFKPLDPANANLAAWYERMKARPSAAA